MNKLVWSDVDLFLEKLIVKEDDVTRDAVRSSTEAGLPEHQVSPSQGKFLHLIALMTGAARILEIGTLGGYSAIWMAKALPRGGRLISLELEPRYTEVARRNIEAAGLSEQVEVRVGPATDLLPVIEREGTGPFDLVFIDADKTNMPEHFRWALKLSHAGTVIIGDNVVRGGAVADRDSSDPSVQGVRRTMELIATEPRLSATALQTVGIKGYDGFVIAVVD